MSILSYTHEILVRDLNQLHKEVESTPDELLWATAPGIINPVGTLAFHLCGNLRHFIGAKLGGSDYVRNLESEFSHDPRSKTELLSHIEDTIEQVDAGLGSLSEADLLREMPDPPAQHKGRTVGFFLIQLCCHFHRHAGQLNYLKRIKMAQLDF
ncbi:DinB family protein [Robiginitalea sp.]|nr:DinB family protein [Robiginitalea sp.]